MADFLEYGLVGLAVGVAFEAVRLAGKVVSNKVNGKKEEGREEKVLEKLRRIESDVKVIGTSVARLERVVIDGNGDKPLVVRVAVVEEKLEGHAGDKGLHTAER